MLSRPRLGSCCSHVAQKYIIETMNGTKSKRRVPAAKHANTYLRCYSDFVTLSFEYY